jgi:zinc and cadmium transporter
MHVLGWIILSTFVISLISLIGVTALSFKHKTLKKILLLFVSLAAGALIGDAFLHLIPESIETLSVEDTFFGVLIGFVLFLIIEKGLHWRHCHDADCTVHNFAYMSLFGETVHNFIDGLLIAASFLINIPTGIATTMAVALHEIPQELGDFGVLLHGGFSKLKALLYNFLSGLAAILGGILGFILHNSSEAFVNFLVPIAAGGFIYIAATDLLPETHKETHRGKSLLNLIFFILGILLMYLLLFLG